MINHTSNFNTDSSQLLFSVYVGIFLDFILEKSSMTSPYSNDDVESLSTVNMSKELSLRCNTTINYIYH